MRRHARLRTVAASGMCITNAFLSCRALQPARDKTGNTALCGVGATASICIPAFWFMVGVPLLVSEGRCLDRSNVRPAIRPRVSCNVKAKERERVCVSHVDPFGTVIRSHRTCTDPACDKTGNTPYFRAKSRGCTPPLVTFCHSPLLSTADPACDKTGNAPYFRAESRGVHPPFNHPSLPLHFTIRMTGGCRTTSAAARTTLRM